MNIKRIILLFVALIGLSELASGREVININDNWKFYFSSENSADYARTISLPHTWAYHATNGLVSTQPTTANYTKSIYIPSEWNQKRVFVKFYGVECVADLLVNGRYVGEHRGGSTAFTFEITGNLNFGAENMLHVNVNNAPTSDILPTSHEENRYGGIYRDVEIIVTDKSAISPLYYGSDGAFIKCTAADEQSAEGSVDVFVNSTVSNVCQLALSIFDAAGDIVFQKIVAKAKANGDAVSVPFSIGSPELWSPEQPNLYKFAIKIIDGEMSDEVEIYSGLRSIEYDGVGQIRLNGSPIPFNAVALYHDYPHVGGAASRVDIEGDMEIIKELGANAIRSTTHPHHPYLYDLCDAEGKMVWIDIPLVKAPYLSDIAYYPTERFHTNGREVLSEIIAQNYNHPSVVMWGIFSLMSTRGDNVIPFIEELNALAKKLDATRPTVAVSDQDGQINNITDLIVWRQSLGWNRGLYSDIEVWSEQLHTKWSNMRSAVSYGQSGRLDQQAEKENYKSTNVYSSGTWNPEGRQREFHQEYAQRLLVDTLFWGVCVNSLFDYKSSRNPLGENNTGLVSFDRRSRKDIFYLYKARWNADAPTLHIADKRNVITSTPLHSITVYASNDSIPSLITSSDTLPMKRVAPWQFVADSITLTDGENRFIVQQAELVDSTKVVLQMPQQATSLRSTRSLSIR